MDSTLRNKVWIGAAAAIERVFTDLVSYQQLPAGNDEERSQLRRRIQSKYGIDAELTAVAHSDLYGWKVSFANRTDAFIKEVYAAGLTDTTKNNLTTDLIYVRKSQTHLVQKALALSTVELLDFLNESQPDVDAAERRLMEAVIFPLMQPNLRFDAANTKAEQDRALDLVSAVASATGSRPTSSR
jgi:hypothetical protein